MTDRRHVLTFISVTILCLCALALPGRALGPSDVEGLWQGRVIFARAQQEVDMTVELARTPEGEWAGTIDVPNQRLRFHPLEGIRVSEGAAGVTVELQFNRTTEHGGRAEYTLRGDLSSDGSVIEGSVTGGDRPVLPFTLAKLGPPGMERPEPVEMPLHELSAGSRELAELFDRDRGRTRLVLLLSPT